MSGQDFPQGPLGQGCGMRGTRKYGRVGWAPFLKMGREGCRSIR